MKTNEVAFAALCAGLLVPLPALAQQGMVMPPPAIQAIDTHLQQSRTREQREAMEYKTTAPVSPRPAPLSQPGAPVKKSVVAKPKVVQSAIQDLDDQALFDRPGPIRADSKSPRKPSK